MKTIRVLVFGATGIGKTSLCNVLTGECRPTSSGAKGVTAKSFIYPTFGFDDCQIEMIDTVGLHESSCGTVPAKQAVVELVDLLEKARDGFSLLVHVARASRITKEQEEDYVFFVEKMTQSNIPVILAVTGCENENPMAAWVDRNIKEYARFSYKAIVPTCFASGGQMEGFYVPKRMQSRDALLRAIARHALSEPRKIYGPEMGNSFGDELARLWNEFVSIAGLPDKCRFAVNETAHGLMTRMGVPREIADAAIKHIPDLCEEIGNKIPVPGGGGR